MSWRRKSPVRGRARPSSAAPATAATEPRTAPPGPPAPAPAALPSPAPAADPLHTGQRLGSYRVVRRIGAGGMGVVFEALHEQLGRRAALKVLSAAYARDPEFSLRFLNEARAANVIRHPGVVDIYEIGQLDDGAAYIIMEYLEGESLAERLERPGAAAPRDAVRIGVQIAAALSVAHASGVVHRDLKPDNIMLIADPLVPGGERVKILDFGIAKLAAAHRRPGEEGARTGTGIIMGTPTYMSPEQCRGTGQVDGQTDVYALGVILYRMLSGRPPFSSPDAAEIIAMHLRDAPPPLKEAAPQVPPALASLVHGMLAKEPAERPTMKDVSEELARLEAANLAVLAPPWRPPGRTLALSLLLVGLVTGLWALRPLSRRDRTAKSRPPAATSVVIPGGTFTMGSSPEEIRAAHKGCLRQPGEDCAIELFEREQPVRRVRVSTFQLDTTEVTNAAFAAWLNLQPDLIVKDRIVAKGGVVLADLFPGIGHGGLSYQDGRYAARPGYERRPVTQVTWDAARLYCAARGQRLPTEAEWEYAAHGARGSRFPWGDDEPRCDGVVFGRRRGLACAQQPSGPGEVGTAPQDVSPQGVHDLAGNVAEWVMDGFRDRYPQCGGNEGTCADPVTDGSEGQRVVRGGDWYVEATMSRATSRGRLRKDDTRGNIGFRCAGSLHP